MLHARSASAVDASLLRVTVCFETASAVPLVAVLEGMIQRKDMGDEVSTEILAVMHTGQAS